MDRLVFADSEARGRNGYFRAVTADVYVRRDKIHVDIMSRRAVWRAPVCLELSLPDAAALARALTGLAEMLQLLSQQEDGKIKPVDIAVEQLKRLMATGSDGTTALPPRFTPEGGMAGS